MRKVRESKRKKHMKTIIDIHKKVSRARFFLFSFCCPGDDSLIFSVPRGGGAKREGGGKRGSPHRSHPLRQSHASQGKSMDL